MVKNLTEEQLKVILHDGKNHTYSPRPDGRNKLDGEEINIVELKEEPKIEKRKK